MSTAFAAEAVRIHELAHLSDREIARATGAAPSTVRDWLRGRTAPTGLRAERVAELAEIVDRLSRVMRPDHIAVWLVKPVAALGDRKPADLIATGKAQRVARVVSALESPTAG
jgi:putative toxin-antitoxin system antitoxin component (TIGR02293 family)